jgi:exopolysaccharide biosynthesis polyprenyl glycosylphosphotransferase
VADAVFILSIYWAPAFEIEPRSGIQFGLYSAAAIPVLLFASYATALYRPVTLTEGIGHLAKSLLTLCIALGAAFIAAMTSIRGIMPLSTVVATLYYGALYAFATRLLWQLCIWLALRRGACVRRIVVLADFTATATLCAAALERHTAGRLRSAACAVLPGRPAGVKLEWLEDAISAGNADCIVLVDDDACLAPWAMPVQALRETGVDIVCLPTAWAVPGCNLVNQNWGSDPFRANISSSLFSISRSAIKRGVDILFATILLTLIAPALLFIAVAIKLDSRGPALFRQQRVGLHGTIFLMLKFRTMSAHLQDEPCNRQTSENDERVTRIGRFLRRSSIDELPQLINVLRGDMSLVGPRPHAHGMTVAGLCMSNLASGYADRHQMKPGITGWAQVNGCRGALNDARKLRRRVALDCYYIDNWSLTMDMIILFRTASLVLRDRHAY